MERGYSALGSPLVASIPSAAPSASSAFSGDSELEAGVGHTARWTAAMRGVEHERPDALFSDPLARAFAGESAFACWQTEIRALNADQPDARSHIAIRTRALDDIVTEEMERMSPADLVQIVSLGAGMCTRPWRLKAPDSELIWFEVDRPDSMRLKAVTARKQGVQPSVIRSADAYKMIGLDFSNPCASLTGSLEEHDFNAEVPTIFVMEGLLMYLELRDVELLAAEINQLVDMGSGLCLIMTVINDGFFTELKNPTKATTKSYPGTKEVATLFKSSWEDGIQDAFKAAGFSLVSIISREDYARKHLGVEMMHYTFPDREMSTEYIIVMKRNPVRNLKNVVCGPFAAQDASRESFLDLCDDTRNPECYCGAKPCVIS